MRAAWFLVGVLVLGAVVALAGRDEPDVAPSRAPAAEVQPDGAMATPTADAAAPDSPVARTELGAHAPVPTTTPPPAPTRDHVVYVHDEHGKPRDRAVATESGRDHLRELPADAQGRITVPGPNAGFLRIAAPGAATVQMEPFEYAGRNDTTVVMPTAATLVVRVLDDQGRLLPDREVLAFLTTPVPGTPRLASPLHQFTDHAGCATFTDAGAAEYSILVPPSGRWRAPPKVTATLVAGQRFAIDVTVPTVPADQCLELTVPELEAEAFPERVHPRFAFQIDGDPTLLRIQRPGLATHVGTPGQNVRVRVVATNPSGLEDLFAPAWPWQTGVVGQTRALEFRRPR
ncbi:MAG: hypothetical protein JNK15_11970 [Planctomycetes bacterium]|nr:hypothetical protein [Planctomycetota bacterium]